MIIRAIRRTDLPAYDAQWLCSRFREGYAYVRNPMDPHSPLLYGNVSDRDSIIPRVKGGKTMVYMICGRICCGKSTYAKRLCAQNRAVLLSIDEITLSLFGQQCGEMHDTYVERTEQYLLHKSLEILQTGVDVVLDWGCWTKKEREAYRAFYEGKGIPYRLHYLDVPEDIWAVRVKKRNAAVLLDDSIAYYIDENLAKKFADIFEPPSKDEVDLVIGV